MLLDKKKWEENTAKNENWVEYGTDILSNVNK